MAQPNTATDPPENPRPARRRPTPTDGDAPAARQLWVAFTEDKSVLVPFGRKIDALEFATSQSPPMAVRPVDFGKPLIGKDGQL